MNQRLSARFDKIITSFGKTWIGWTVLSITAYVSGLILAAIAMFLILTALGVGSSDGNMVLVTFNRALMYGIVALLLLGIPLLIHRRMPIEEHGLRRLMEWKDIGIGLGALVVYMLGSGLLLTLGQFLLTGVNWEQEQVLEVGRVFGSDLVLAFVLLVVLIPIAEEWIFRGFLYGGLRARKLPVWASALVVSVLFGLGHGQLNVGIDTFVLSYVACIAREATGTIWPGVVLHMLKNFIAFSLLYVGQGL